MNKEGEAPAKKDSDAASIDDSKTDKKDTVSIDDSKVTAYEAKIKELEADNYKYREKQREKEEKDRQQKDIAQKALEEQGKFEELAKSRKDEFDSLRQELKDSQKDQIELKEVQKRFETLEKSTNERVKQRLKDLSSEQRYQIKAFYPDFEDFDSFTKSDRIERYLSQINANSPLGIPGGTGSGHGKNDDHGMKAAIESGQLHNVVGATLGQIYSDK